MPAPDRAMVIHRLRSWLTRTNPDASVDIDSRTDIIESRILESLEVVEFILFLEAESGRPILSEELNPNDLRTLDSIYQRFFEQPA
jgi:acyl carrier protein